MTPQAGLLIRFIIDLEGGLVDDPRDPGGITKYGISLRFLKQLNGSASREEILDLDMAGAVALYEEHFWDKCQCDRMPPPLGLLVLGGAINQGPQRVLRRLQRTVATNDDGIIGEHSLSAIHSCWIANPQELLRDFTARRAKMYAETKNVDIYGRGWYRRLLLVYSKALEMM